MVKLLDRVKQAVSGTASSTTLGAAAEGFRTFNTAGAATNDVCRYAIEDDNGAFEIGTIKITGSTTGTRTVELSSNSNNALTLTGNAVIFATLSAADLSGNAAPIWTTTPPSSLNLATDGSTAVTLAGVAIDEFPVHYSWDGYSGTTVYDADTLPPQLASAPTFSGGTASLVGSSTSSNAGSFNFRLKASDGVKTATAITAVNLSFGYDITSGAYDNLSLSVTSQDTSPRGLAFNSDGTKMFVIGATNDTVYQYSLSTGFSLATGNVTYDNVSFSVGSQESEPQDLAFNSDGTKMFVIGSSSDTVYQYSLSTGFSLATGNVTYDNLSFSVGSQDVSPQGLVFNSDGTKMFVIGAVSGAVYQYSLTTGFSLATGNVTYDNVSFSVASQDGLPCCLVFNLDGTKMFVIGLNSDTIYQYSTSG